MWNLPSSSWATWHYELFAMLLLGSDYSGKDPGFPAVSTGSRLQANLRRHLLLPFLCRRCRSTCSVLSKSICRKHVETATKAYNSAGPLQLIRQLHKSHHASEFEQLPTETRKKQKTLQPLFSARHQLKLTFFKLSHLALRTFCHAAAGIRGQKLRSNSSSRDDWLKVSSKSAAPSAPFVSWWKHLQCFVRINLSKAPGLRRVHVYMSPGSGSLGPPMVWPPSHTP